jgi:cell division protein FtsW
LEKTKGHIDWFIFLSVAGLMLFSLAFVYSASGPIAEARWGSSEKLFLSHSIRVVIGLFLIILFSRIDYHLWKKLSMPVILISLVFLVLVFVLGSQINNVYRWVNLGFFSFQPSELAKFALMLRLAAMLSERDEFVRNFRLGFLPMLFWIILVVGLVAIQPSFSTAMVIFLIALSLLFIGNTNVLHLAGFSLLSLVGAGIYGISAPYRMQRIIGYLGDSIETHGGEAVNFQVNQAILAFGNGGVLGVGPGQSRQSHFFLPESYGDFIFSIIGEEYGFIGTIILLLVFCLILWRGYRVVKHAPDNFGYYLSAGILLTIAVYAFVNAGVNCGLLPATGLPMPFVSYGGSAVLFYAVAMGVFLNISSHAGVFPGKKKTTE